LGLNFALGDCAAKARGQKKSYRKNGPWHFTSNSFPFPIQRRDHRLKCRGYLRGKARKSGVSATTSKSLSRVFVVLATLATSTDSVAECIPLMLGPKETATILGW